MTQLRVSSLPGPADPPPGPAEQARPDGDEFRRIMSHWPTGVSVVTTLAGRTPVGCTANAMMSVSLVPPLLVVALASRSTTLAALRRTGAFGLNMLASHQRDVCLRFARGRQDDRFRDQPYRWQLRLPLLCETVAAIICTVRETTPCGDHVLVIGAPVWCGVGEHGQPLVFHHNGYHQLRAAGEGAAL